MDFLYVYKYICVCIFCCQMPWHREDALEERCIVMEQVVVLLLPVKFYQKREL